MNSIISFKKNKEGISLLSDISDNQLNPVFQRLLSIQSSEAVSAAALFQTLVNGKKELSIDIDQYSQFSEKEDMSMIYDFKMEKKNFSSFLLQLNSAIDSFETTYAKS